MKMMSVESPEFNRFTNDHILREWDALAAMHAGRHSLDNKVMHDPEARAIAWERSTMNTIRGLRGLIQGLSSAYANRIDHTRASYAAPRSTALCTMVSLEANRT